MLAIGMLVVVFMAAVVASLHVVAGPAGPGSAHAVAASPSGIPSASIPLGPPWT